TRCLSDWSSDVCSSDLHRVAELPSTAFFAAYAAPPVDDAVTGLPRDSSTGAVAALATTAVVTPPASSNAALETTASPRIRPLMQIGRASGRERGERAAG